MRLRESQLRNVETENKRLNAKLEDLQIQSQQEKKELEAIILELQAQLYIETNTIYLQLCAKVCIPIVSWFKIKLKMEGFPEAKRQSNTLGKILSKTVLFKQKYQQEIGDKYYNWEHPKAAQRTDAVVIKAKKIQYVKPNTLNVLV